MEKQLSFVLKLSLQEMALRRVVVNLWNEDDVLDSIVDIRIKKIPWDIRQYKKCEEWQETVEKVKGKVSKLVMPESLKKRMMQIVIPIGLQIQDWEILMDEYFRDSREDLHKRFLEQLCWTSAGDIDFQKTAEKLLSIETLDAVKRYRLACLYCLEESIPVLWEQLPEDYKGCFLDEPEVVRIEEQMEIYWHCVLKGEESDLDFIIKRFYSSTTFHQRAFEISAYKGKRALTEYFFQKLTYKERVNSLIRLAYDVAEKLCKEFRDSTGVSDDFPTENLCGVLCYLLSVMSSEEQMQVFKKHSVGVLICFLDWPWQDLLLDIADFIWTFLPKSTYRSSTTVLLRMMTRSIQNSGYYFPNLLQEFFLRSPSGIRIQFILEFGVIFRDFSYAEDTETIQVFFRNIALEDMTKLPVCYFFSEFLKPFIFKDKWHLVELSLREATLSKQDLQSVQFSANRYIRLTFEGEERVHKIRRLKICFELLDETEASDPNIRSSEINH